MLKVGNSIFKKAKMSAILIKSFARQKCYTAELDADTRWVKSSGSWRKSSALAPPGVCCPSFGYKTQTERLLAPGSSENGRKGQFHHQRQWLMHFAP